MFARAWTRLASALGHTQARTSPTSSPSSSTSAASLLAAAAAGGALGGFGRMVCPEEQDRAKAGFARPDDLGRPRLHQPSPKSARSILHPTSTAMAPSAQPPLPQRALLVAEAPHAPPAAAPLPEPTPSLGSTASAASAASAAPRRCTVKVVTEGHPEYIDGIQIWGVGIKEDPVPGEKRGKGVQHLRSTVWTYDLATFIQDHYDALCSMLRYARKISEEPGCQGYDYRYFVNCSEGLFHKACHHGFRTAISRDWLLLASWSLMAAAEVGCRSPSYDRDHVRHSPEQRERMREEFYRRYLEPDVSFVADPEDPEMERTLGRYGLASCRFDLIPCLALERLDLHNELCVVKWKKDPGAWMRNGFCVSSRVDSMHRHYLAIHTCDWSEDHIAHGIWNLMAIYHVLVVFPDMNDMTNFAALGEARDLRG